MEKRITVILNEYENEMLEDIKDYWEHAFLIKMNTSQMIRFLIQMEKNKEQGIELDREKMWEEAKKEIIL